MSEIDYLIPCKHYEKYNNILCSDNFQMKPKLIFTVYSISTLEFKITI